MCELFGASAARPQNLARWLEPLRLRGGATADNPDGWGIASWTAGALQIDKVPEAGARSARFADIAQKAVAEIVIAHVRKARMPPVPGLHNTHPFAHACCGRQWVFAHNGLVPDIIGVQPPRLFCQPRGETDSEHAFCYLLAKIAGCYQDAQGGTWMQRLAQLAGSIAVLGKFNFLLSDGDSLIAYGHDRLHYLESPEGSNGLTLIATEPLTAEPWRPFARRELRVYKSGALATQVIATTAESNEAPDAMRAPGMSSRT